MIGVMPARRDRQEYGRKRRGARRTTTSANHAEVLHAPFHPSPSRHSPTEPFEAPERSLELDTVADFELFEAKRHASSFGELLRAWVDLRPSVSRARISTRAAHLDEKLQVSLGIRRGQRRVGALNELAFDVRSADAHQTPRSRLPSQARIDVLARWETERLLGMLELELVKAGIVIDEVDGHELGRLPAGGVEELRIDRSGSSRERVEREGG